MYQSRLDQVFPTRKKKVGESGSAAACTGGRTRNWKSGSGTVSCSQSKKGSLEGFLVDSTPENAAPGTATRAGVPEKAVGDTNLGPGTLAQRNLPLRPCFGYSPGKVKKSTETVLGDEEEEKAWNPQSSSRALPTDLLASTNYERHSEQAEARNCARTERGTLEPGAGAVDAAAEHVDDDSHQQTQFLAIFCNVPVPTTSKESPLGGSKREPSPTTLNSSECTDRKKPRVSYKDLWAASCAEDSAAEEVPHKSPEKKPRLSTSPQKNHEMFELCCARAGTGDGLNTDCDETRSDATPQLCIRQDLWPLEGVSSDSAKVQAAQDQNTCEEKVGQMGLVIDTNTPRQSHSQTGYRGFNSNSPSCQSLCTPLARINEKSAAPVKLASPWSYRNCMFSPGDEFWNEAIEAVDDLLASKTCNADTFQDAMLQEPKSDEGKRSSDEPLGRVSVCHDTVLSAGCDEGREDRFRGQMLIGNLDASSVVSDRNTVSGSQAADSNGINGSNVSMVTAEVESPLPVRHFSFENQCCPITGNVSGVGSCEMEITPKTNALLQQHKPSVDNVTGSSILEGIEREARVTPSHVAEVERRVRMGVRHAPVKQIAGGADVSKNQDGCPSGREAAANTATLRHPLLDALPAVADHVPVHVSKEKTSVVESPEVRNQTQEQVHSASMSCSNEGPAAKHNLDLVEWLPSDVTAIYVQKGVTMFYPWQVECLLMEGVLQGRNLVYSASTSAGKSLVAEVLMLRQIIATGRRAILVLPYVALCTEKAEHLESLLLPLGKRVRSFYGTQGGASFPKDASVAVCTIEKANIVINKLLEEDRLGEIATIVIDELHMVGDQDRGYLLELMLTKLRYAAGEGDGPYVTGTVAGNPESSLCMRNQGGGLQIIGMSATISNGAAVAKWLKAAFYETRFRPVPLIEFIKVGNIIYNKKMEGVRKLRTGADLGGKDPDHVVEMCHEVVREGHSVLLFCSSRKACETSARHIAKYLCPPLKEKVKDDLDVEGAIEQLRKCPAGLCEVLAETLPRRVAYHHAGLTTEEREIVESCFRQGTVQVLAATSTLAAGVNLPARRVILRQPRIGLDYLDGTRYRQMTGRAGRAGLDTIGESVLICKQEEVKKMVTVMQDSCQPLRSCLAEDKTGMTRALLEVVAGGIVQTANDVHRYVKCTLLSSTQPFEDVVKSAQESLRWLCHQRFVEWNGTTLVYTTTPLGRAAFGSSLTPEESLVVFEDLAKAREGFVLASDLHLVYQVTPVYIELEPDWSLFYQRFIELSPLDQAVGNRVGVSEPFLMRMAHGGLAAVHMRTKGIRDNRSPRGKLVGRPSISCLTGRGSPLGSHMSVDQMLRVCRRFYVSLMLSRLIQEIPLTEICEAFRVPRGTVQGLQERAGRFAGMVTAFCERLGWHDLEGLVSKFQSRVSFGVRSEIVELTEIPFVKAARARALYKAGFRTVQAVAEATVAELGKALHEASAWSAQDNARPHMQQRAQLGIVKKIKQGARRLVLDKAEEARIAAFSAFRALGLDIPSLSDPPLVSATIAPLVDDRQQEDKAVVPHEGRQTEDRHVRDVEVPEQPAMCQQNTTRGCKDDHQVSNGVGIKPDVRGIESNNSRTRDEAHVVKKVPVDIPSWNKRANEVSNHLALFGGLAMTEKISPPPGDLQNQTREFVSSGPIDVDKMPGGFEEFFSRWQAVEEFAFDLHFSTKVKGCATSLYEMEGVAVCWQSSPIYYVSFRRVLQPKQDIEDISLFEQRWKKVGNVLSATQRRKITWDVKLQMHALQNAWFLPLQPTAKADAVQVERTIQTVERKMVPLSSIELCEPYIDVRTEAWLLWPDEESGHQWTLEQEVKRRLPGEVAAAASRSSRWMNQMGRAAHNGCCRRAAQIWELHSAFWKLLVAEGLHEPLMRFEMPLVKVLAAMESFRISIDINDCRHMQGLLMNKMRDLESVAHTLAGMDFSLSAPADVANVLYKHLKLPVPPGCNKGKLHPSTSKQALDHLRDHHPLVGVIKEHRIISKLLHGTLGSIMSCAKPVGERRYSCLKELHEISGRWLQTSTATGRLAMEEPNLQCVEHKITFEFRQGSPQNDKFLKSEKYEVNARDIFVPSQESWVLLSADYSQIEVRLMAHFSGDMSMISLLSKPCGDLFRQIAAQWTGCSENTVTDIQREQTKRMVYGILYGMGVNALAEQLDCSVEEATRNSDRFKLAFPHMNAWLQRTVEKCRRIGYVTTFGGRKRFLEKISNGNRVEQAKAERQAANSICQGSAADLIKMAMVKLHATITGRTCSCSLLEESGRHHKGCSSLVGRCRLLLQIHDELVLEVDSSVANEAAALVRSCMQGAASLQVPLLVKIRTGKSWGSLQPYDETK